MHNSVVLELGARCQDRVDCLPPRSALASSEWWDLEPTLAMLGLRGKPGAGPRWVTVVAAGPFPHKPWLVPKRVRDLEREPGPRLVPAWVLDSERALHLDRKPERGLEAVRPPFPPRLALDLERHLVADGRRCGD
ncbi:hypothetical protein MTO96_028225 [Rhipicephalus appendiculatus]